MSESFSGRGSYDPNEVVCHGFTGHGRSIELPGSDYEKDGEGCFDRLDLGKPKVGDILGVETTTGYHVFQKIYEDDGALYGWQKFSGNPDEKPDYPIVLSVLESNKHGSSFLTGSVILDKSSILAVVRPESSKPNESKSLDAVVSIYLKKASELNIDELAQASTEQSPGLSTTA